jgi:hypothetical protein
MGDWTGQAGSIITAVYGGVPRQNQLLVNYNSPGSIISSFVLNPTQVIGGNSVTGTVTISSQAPQGGAVVLVTSGNSTVAHTPLSVTVPANATSANFTISTSAVSNTTPVTISATFGQVTLFASVTVTHDIAHMALVRVNDGSAQRSRVSSLTVAFDTQVNFAGAISSAFTLQRTGGGLVTFSASANIVNGVTMVTLTNFSGIEGQSGSLRDGRYTLTALAAQISNAAGQLNGGTNMTFSDAQGLFRFYGDINGDQIVNGLDFGRGHQWTGLRPIPNSIRHFVAVIVWQHLRWC